MSGRVDLRQFDSPDEVRVFEKGRLAVVRVGGMTVGRAEYEPGWKWSVHVGPTVGAALCTVEHVGMVLSGTATVAFQDGRVIELQEGALFHVQDIRVNGSHAAAACTGRYPPSTRPTSGASAAS